MKPYGGYVVPRSLELLPTWYLAVYLGYSYITIIRGSQLVSLPRFGLSSLETQQLPRWDGEPSAVFRCAFPRRLTA
jgi:hypothetical protein